MMRAWSTINVCSEDMAATVLEKTCRGGQDKVEQVVVTGQVGEEECYWEAKVVVEELFLKEGVRVFYERALRANE